MLERPGLLPLPEDTPVAQQLLPDPVAGGGAGPAQVVAAAHQITQTLLLGLGGPNERELARAVELRELPASRRSVLTRSPGRTGISDGATMSHATPIEVSSRSRS